MLDLALEHAEETYDARRLPFLDITQHSSLRGSSLLPTHPPTHSVAAQPLPMLETLDLATEESLDALDPLRHLRNDYELDTGLMPIQPPSIYNQTLRLSFPSTGDDVPNPVQVHLSVDASPGCGGIAWPAGEVGHNAQPQMMILCLQKRCRIYP